MLSRWVVSQVKHNSWFVGGMVLGLWVALVLVPLDEGIEVPPACAARRSAPDDYEPQREERPLGNAPRGAARALQRPRYYSTELGMRGALMAAVLSSEEALKSQISALNATAGRLQPALKFFITASAMSAAPGLANVVGFTDTREMLKPFHTLKYLADNYLEEYDFFFLVSDAAFVNSRRLTELVSKLSVSQDVYMGTLAEDDSHYCSLEGGIVLSNSVLRAVHGELDWCVRNSYSPHHHENIGRCVLHAAKLACMQQLQGETYVSSRAASDAGEVSLREQLADAVTVTPVHKADEFYQIHAYVSRVHLQRDRAAVRRLRGAVWRGAARLPPHYRNATWPAGLRRDPGLAPPPPNNRFDYVRWISFNASHSFMPHDHTEVALIRGADRAALDLVLESVRAWAAVRWDGARASLVEGAWRWQPAAELRYRLLMRVSGGTQGGAEGGTVLKQVEVVRPLGAARLAPVRYVTESARLHAVLAVPAALTHTADALRFLARYEDVALLHDKNVALYVAIVGENANNTAITAPLRAAVDELAHKHGAALTVCDVPDALQAPEYARLAGALPEPEYVRLAGALPEPEYVRLAGAGRAALRSVAARVPHDALVLLLPPHADFNQDFLNRVRMNTISGYQWYLPSAFARHSVYDHPRFVTAVGAKPATNTGRFNVAATLALSVYAGDYVRAAELWRGGAGGSAAEILAKSPLRCIRAPEPALVLEPRGMPCGDVAAPRGDVTAPQSCARAHMDTLDLGARHSLAQLLLEVQAEQES